MISAISNIIRRLFKARNETLIFIGTVFVGTFYAWYIYSLKLTTIFVDQNSHLNIARQIFDSITPGISQIGFWPPLLHVLMAPFTIVTPLFESGLAGAFTLIPVFGLGSIFLYRILYNFTHNQLVSFAGVLFFITNPYILYYAVTPMTELLFIVAIFGVAYFLMKWLQNQNIAMLIYLGIFVTLASLARFEGFVLIPVVGLVLFIKLLIQKKKYYEIEALGILFSLVAGLGLVFTLFYGWVFAGDPLIFMNGAWSSAAQQQSFSSPAAHDFGMSLLYLLEASNYMMSAVLVLTAVISFFILMILLWSDKRFLAFIGISAVLISPFMFDLFAVYQGSAVLYLKNLPPFEGFLNERYGLYWFGFIVFVPIFLVGVISEKFNLKFSFVGTSISVMLLAMILSSNVSFLYSVVYTNQFEVLNESSLGTLAEDQRQLAKVLKGEYDYGKILITRALQNFVTVKADIPLKNYILESNYQYYDSALDKPWFYARFVVMYNPNIYVQKWRKENELVSKVWSDSEIFNHTYELVFENDSERLYRLKEDVLLKSIAFYGIDEFLIPSLNSKMVRWNTAELSEYLNNKMHRVFTLIEGDEPLTASVSSIHSVATVQ